jgi:hypothetical protein
MAETETVVAPPAQTTDNTVQSNTGDSSLSQSNTVESTQPVFIEPAPKTDVIISERAKEVVDNVTAGVLERAKARAAAAGATEQAKPEVKAEAKQESKPVVESKDSKSSDIGKVEQIKPEAAKPEQAKKEEDEVQLTDDDLKPSLNDKPKTRKRIEKLLKIAEEAKQEKELTAKQVAELNSKIAALEKGAPGSVTDEMKQQLDELAMYKRRYSLEKDESLVEKFDKPIKQYEERIIGKLRENALPEWVAKQIETEGGWRKFAGDTKGSIKFVAGRDGDGKPIVKEMVKADFAEYVINAMPVLARNELNTYIGNQINTEEQKNTYLETETKRASEYFAEQEKRSKEQQEAQSKSVEDVVKAWSNTYNEIEKAEWLKDKAVDETATAEEKERIKDYNEYTKQIRELGRTYMQPKKIEDYQKMYPEIVTEAMAYHHTRRELADRDAALAKRDAEIKRLSEELDAVKKGSRTVTGSLMAGTTKASSAPVKGSSAADIASSIAERVRMRARGM